VSKHVLLPVAPLCCLQRQGLQQTLLPEAQTLFVEIRLAALLIATPPNDRPTVKGLGRFVVPKGVTLDFLLKQAWEWRDSHVTPEGKFTQCVLTQTGGERKNLDGVMAFVQATSPPALSLLVADSEASDQPVQAALKSLRAQCGSSVPSKDTMAKFGLADLVTDEWPAQLAVHCSS